MKTEAGSLKSTILTNDNQINQAVKKLLNYVCNPSQI